MKRIILALMLCTALLLSSCAAKKSAMYIQPAKLTAQEEQMKAMAGQGRFVHIFDYQLDKQVQTIAIQVYRLEEGQWVPCSAGGRMAMPDHTGKGRLALNFYHLAEGMGITVQGKESSYSSLTVAPADASPDAENMALYTTALSTLEELRYDVELPIALQIHTSKSEVKSIGANVFHQPDLIAAEGHDHVYAVTVTFSDTPME